MKQFRKLVTIFVFLFGVNKIAASQSDSTDILKLDICIKAALQYVPSLKEGSVQTEIKKTEISKTKSYQFPYLTGNANYNLTNQNKLDNNFNSLSYGINANQVVWQFGCKTALEEQSKYLYQAELSKYNASQQNIILQIRLLYFEYLKNIKILDVAKNNLEQANLFLASATEKKAIGIGKNSDVLKAESDVAEATYILSTYENSILKVRNELNQLTGLNINEDTKTGDELFLVKLDYLNYNSDSLFVFAKNNIPEIKTIDNIILSQDAYIKSVKAELFPKISAGAGYNWYYNPAYKDNGYWNAGLSLNWDLFSGYSKKDQIKIEKFKSKSISYQKEDMLLNLNKEVNNQLLTFNESYKQIGIIEILLKSTSENLNTVQEEYKEGISSMLELTNARTENFRAQERYIQAWYNCQLSLALLERSLGIIPLN